MKRANRGTVIGLATLVLALAGRDARADERWEFDPTTGDWLQVDASDETEEARSQGERTGRGRARSDGGDHERPEVVPGEERAGLDAPPAKPRPAVRSGGAIAGGVVLTSVGALFAGVGGLALLYQSATRAEPEEYAAPAVVSALGLGAVAGGITLMVWGGRRDEPSYGLRVAPTRVQLDASF